MSGCRLRRSPRSSSCCPVAGNETTRNAISHGMVALSRYPDARDKWWADFDGVAATAVEEIVRWATPVIFMRTRPSPRTSNSAVRR